MKSGTKENLTKEHSRQKRGRGLAASIRSVMLGESWGLVSLLLAAIAIIQVWDYGRGLVCIDYYQFWVVGRALREGIAADVYSGAERQRLGEMMWQKMQTQVGSSADARDIPKQYYAAKNRQVLETYSTPWLYTLFGFSSSDSFDKDQNRFLSLSLACYILAIVYLCHILGYSPASTALVLALLVIWFTPAHSDMHVGNVGRFQLLFLALFLWVQSKANWAWRHVLGGFVLGLTVMFKPNFAFIVVCLCAGWVVFRQYRKLLLECAGMLFGALLAFALSSWYVGSARLWLSWAAEMPRLMNEYDHSIVKGNYALAELISEQLWPFSATVLFLICFGLFVAVLVRIGRTSLRGSNPGDSAAERWDDRLDLKRDTFFVGVGCVLSLLGVQLVWVHYFVLTVPLALYLLRPIESEDTLAVGARGTLRSLALLALAMVAWEPFKIPLSLEGAPLRSATLASVGTLLLFLLALFDCKSFLMISAQKIARPAKRQ